MAKKKLTTMKAINRNKSKRKPIRKATKKLVIKKVKRNAI